MKELTHTHKFRISETQYNTLKKLKTYDVKVDAFIRAAISEKIKRDWQTIKEKPKKEFCPF